MENNDYAVCNMLQSLDNAITYASFAGIEKWIIVEKIKQMKEELCSTLVELGLMVDETIIKNLKEFIDNVESDLTKIGDEFESVEEVIQKYRLYIFEKEGERNDYGDYWFNTFDGELSGRISYDEDDDRYYVGREVEIYDERINDWAWSYDRRTERCTRSN
jgi:hypothetical protein